jgi:hypothetical protein
MWYKFSRLELSSITFVGMGRGGQMAISWGKLQFIQSVEMLVSVK